MEVNGKMTAFRFLKIADVSRFLKMQITNIYLWPKFFPAVYNYFYKDEKSEQILGNWKEEWCISLNFKFLLELLENDGYKINTNLELNYIYLFHFLVLIGF